MMSYHDIQHHSDPDSEERETELKASALIDAIVRDDVVSISAPEAVSVLKVDGVAIKREKNVLLVDHEDSFVHTLANYLRQTGKQLNAPCHEDIISILTLFIPTRCPRRQCGRVQKR